MLQKKGLTNLYVFITLESRLEANNNNNIASEPLKKFKTFAN